MGTSGFSYPEWRGSFYPEKLAAGRMLEHYATRLTGVELNGTFYRTPPPSTVEKWAASVPDRFRFSPKAHRGLTYSGAAFDKVGLAAIVGPQYAAFGERLGPVLLQFPPPLKPDPGLLDSLLEALGVPAAAEFRDGSWLTPEVYSVCAQRGAAVVVTDAEDWPAAEPPELPVAYFRLRRDYDEEALRAWAPAVRRALQISSQVHVYFRHDERAPWRAETLMRLLGGAGG